MEYQTLAIAVPPQDPESAEATWALPEGWAEVPNERFTSNDIEYAVVSIPKNADTTGYTTGPAPMTCIDGQITANGTPIATCPPRLPGYPWPFSRGTRGPGSLSPGIHLPGPARKQP